jgi:transcriptional regulator with XRE-family HTH domain
MVGVASISERVGDLGSYLREQREHAKLSVRQLAAVTGVSNPYLSQIERGLRRPSAEVLQQIARGLRISAEALYVRAGILEENHRIDVQLAIHADPLLTERQKRVLLDIYATFRSEHAREESADGNAEADEGPAEVAADAPSTADGGPADPVAPDAPEPARSTTATSRSPRRTSTTRRARKVEDSDGTH